MANFYHFIHQFLGLKTDIYIDRLLRFSLFWDRRTHIISFYVSLFSFLYWSLFLAFLFFFIWLNYLLSLFILFLFYLECLSLLYRSFRNFCSNKIVKIFLLFLNEMIVGLPDRGWLIEVDWFFFMHWLLLWFVLVLESWEFREILLYLLALLICYIHFFILSVIAVNVMLYLWMLWGLLLLHLLLNLLYWFFCFCILYSIFFLIKISDHTLVFSSLLQLSIVFVAIITGWLFPEYPNLNGLFTLNNFITFLLMTDITDWVLSEYPNLNGFLVLHYLIHKFLLVMTTITSWFLPEDPNLNGLPNFLYFIVLLLIFWQDVDFFHLLM